MHTYLLKAILDTKKPMNLGMPPTVKRDFWAQFTPPEKPMLTADDSPGTLLTRYTDNRTYNLILERIDVNGTPNYHITIKDEFAKSDLMGRLNEPCLFGTKSAETLQDALRWFEGAFKYLNERGD
ncbi:MAG: hypothetical protein AABX07_02205 [Nanoarchaeota archaeon]